MKIGGNLLTVNNQQLNNANVSKKQEINKYRVGNTHILCIGRFIKYFALSIQTKGWPEKKNPFDHLGKFVGPKKKTGFFFFPGPCFCWQLQKKKPFDRALICTRMVNISKKGVFFPGP